MALPEEYEDRDEQFRDRQFQKYIQRFCDRQKWEYIPGFPKTVDNYSLGNKGWVYAMKVL